MIVCIEGLDGAGKKTQAHLLFNSLRSNGIETTVIPHPDYSSGHGKLIKSYLHGSEKVDAKALFFTYLADIAKDTQKIIDADSKGVTILDRYYMSTVAYQCAAGFDYSAASVITLITGLPKPDSIVYLDISPENSFKRKAAMNEKMDRHEADPVFLGKVRQVYLQEIHDKFPEKTKWLVLDAMESKESLHEAILNDVNKSFKKLRR